MYQTGPKRLNPFTHHSYSDFFFSQKQKTFNKEPSTEDTKNIYNKKEIGKNRVK